ncbi:hypothetical protein G6M50_06270 [Agrobacterium rhizogenes]|nr:hypothetical protein [Rhizobium rhizogenes]NTJ77408.1 hypothetical protein [Rhizobium rhizogenes]
MSRIKNTGPDQQSLESLSGNRKKINKVDAIRFPDIWGKSLSDRAIQFREWRYIAMQVVHRSSGPFRVIAILDVLFSLEDCECWATDEEFAHEAGHCNVKTISRELQALRSLGLVFLEKSWIEKYGKKVRARRLRLALPYDLKGVHQR